LAAALFIHFERKKENPLTYVVLAFVSVALLLAVVALIKERRLRLALQDILRRLINRWRSYANTQDDPHADRRSVDIDGDRV
jgi:hypothetical protein